MSWLSEAISGVQNAVPNVGGFAPNINPLQLSPVVNVEKKKMTPEQEQAAKQVDAKMTAGQMAEGGDAAADTKYLQKLYDDMMSGFNSDPNAYRGKSAVDLARAGQDRILQRNSTNVANQNARLGKMGATKGADSLRLSIENSLTNQQDLSNNDANASIDAYGSQVDEMLKAYGTQRQAGMDAVQRQLGRTADVQAGWQGELGRFGKAFVEGGGVGGAAMYGAGKVNQGLGQNDAYFRNTFGNAPVNAANLLLDPSESARLLKDQWNKQAGKDNPFIQDASAFDPTRRK